MCHVFVTEENETIFTHENWVNTHDIPGLTVPVMADITGIKPGDRLKICNTRERFYVLVEEVNHETGLLFTRLSTHLLYNYPYKYGDYMIVKAENIYEIIKYEYFQEQVKKYVAKIEAGQIDDIVKTLENPTRIVPSNENKLK